MLRARQREQRESRPPHASRAKSQYCGAVTELAGDRPKTPEPSRFSHVVPRSRMLTTSEQVDRARLGLPFAARTTDPLPSECKVCHKRFWQKPNQQACDACRDNYRLKKELYVSSKLFCGDCGEDDPRLLDFDHIRGPKLGNVSDMLKAFSVSLEDFRLEISKCELVCRHCHIKRTALRARTGQSIPRMRKPKAAPHVVGWKTWAR